MKTGREWLLVESSKVKQDSDEDRSRVAAGREFQGETDSDEDRSRVAAGREFQGETDSETVAGSQ